MVLQTPLRSVTIKSEKQMNDPAEKVTAIKPAPRQKSQETIFKQELRTVRKEIAALDKKVANFKALKKEMDTAEIDLAGLQAREEAIKQDLIKELDLA